MSLTQNEAPPLVEAYDREEIIHGKKILSPRPRGKHVLAVSALQSLICGLIASQQKSPWWILAGPQLFVNKHTLIPDLAGWRKERMPKVPDGYLFETEPDWVCEVVSDSSRIMDRKTKPPLSLEGSIKHYWLVEPEQRTLEVLRATPDGWLWVKTFTSNDMVRAEPFEAVEFDLLFVWGEDREEPSTEEK